MSVDTLNKRSSAMDMGGPIELAMPPPDGSISVGTRAHLLWLYSGIAEDESAPVGSSADDWIIRARRRGRR